MRKYEDEMDTVCGALQAAEMMLRLLPDDSLDELEKAVQTADTMAFMMAAPMEFNITIKRLDDQKKLLEWARNTISIYKSLEKSYENSM